MSDPKGGPYTVVTQWDGKWWRIYVPTFEILTVASERDGVEYASRELIAGWLFKDVNEIQVMVTEDVIPPNAGQGVSHQ